MSVCIYLFICKLQSAGNSITNRLVRDKTTVKSKWQNHYLHFFLCIVQIKLQNVYVCKKYLQFFIICTCITVGCSKLDTLEKIYEQSKEMPDLSKNLRMRPVSDRFGTQIQPGDLPHHVLIFRLFHAEHQLYRAFCAGSIIGPQRVLSSSSCFLTNRKAPRYDYSALRVGAGVIQTVTKRDENNTEEQWRIIQRVYAQRFYKFPAYNLAILTMDIPWVFNIYVNKIPFESTDHDFDGVCIATGVKAVKSWSMIKYVYADEVEMIQRKRCERILQRSCLNYFCTNYNNINKFSYADTEGGGLICYNTGDPAEVDPRQGVLVGVTSQINLRLPSLHMRIGRHSQWVSSCCSKCLKVICNNVLLALSFMYVIVNSLQE